MGIVEKLRAMKYTKKELKEILKFDRYHEISYLAEEFSTEKLEMRREIENIIKHMKYHKGARLC